MLYRDIRFLEFVIHFFMQLSYSVSSMNRFILIFVVALSHFTVCIQDENHKLSGSELLFEKLSHLVLVNAQQFHMQFSPSYLLAPAYIQFLMLYLLEIHILDSMNYPWSSCELTCC